MDVQPSVLRNRGGESTLEVQRSAKFLRIPQTNDGITVILKIAGDLCNLDCHYCFEKRKPASDAPYIDPDTLTAFLTLCQGRPLNIVLHGGEPLLMGLTRYRKLREVLRNYPGHLRLGIQTNGTLLTEAWLDELSAEPRVDIAVSLDGDAEANSHRVDWGNRDSFERVEKSLRMLERRGRDIGVISVISRRSLGRHKEILDHLASYSNIRHLKLAPCLDYNAPRPRAKFASSLVIESLNSGKGMPAWATTPEEFATFAGAATEHWIDKGYFRQFLLDPTYSVVANLSGGGTGYTEFSWIKEPFMVTLYPDGRIGGSDHFSMPESQLGHVRNRRTLQAMIESACKGPFYSQLESLVEKCVGCSVQDTCKGGSLADRVRYNAAGLGDAYCEGRKILIDTIENIVHVAEVSSRKVDQ